MENLMPVADEFSSKGHKVVMSYYLSRMNKNSNEVFHTKQNIGGYEDLISGIYNPDIVILTQPWWEYEKNVVKVCKERNIPFFVLEHSPQMLVYNKKASNYRKNIMGAKAHIMWGEESFNIMNDLGANSKLPILGSPRVEWAMKSCKDVNKENLVVIYTTSWVYTSDNFYKKVKEIHSMVKEKGWKLEVQAHPRFHKNNDAFEYINKNKIPFHQNISTVDSVTLLKKSKINIYDFPSSLMPLSCLFNNDIYSTYCDSDIKEIKEYGKVHQSFIKNVSELILAHKNENLFEKNNFIKNNISIEEKSSSNRIYSYIMRSI
jgi:hypothetical protein